MGIDLFFHNSRGLQMKSIYAGVGQMRMWGMTLTAVFALAPVHHASAQGCSGDLLIEAELSYPASPGQVGVIAIDGEAVWISQSAVALRFVKQGGAWVNDSFIPIPSSVSPKLMSVSNGRVLLGGAVYVQSVQGQWMVAADVGLSGADCDFSGGNQLGSTFAIVGWGCLNFVIRGALGGGYLTFPPPPGYPFQQTPQYLLRAQGNRALIAIRQYYGPSFGPVRMYESHIGGSETAPVFVGGASPIDGPMMVSLKDFAPMSGGVIAAMLGVNDNNYRVYVWDSATWGAVPQLDSGESFIPDSVSASSSHAIATGGGKIAELVRSDTGAWTLRQVASLEGNEARAVTGGDLVATTILAPQDPAGHRLVIMRFPSFTDCNLNDIDDCLDLTAGSADVDANGIPDECQCLADLLIDNQVNGIDLAVIIANWGEGSGSLGDINRDGIVAGGDLALLLGSWGPCEN